MNDYLNFCELISVYLVATIGVLSLVVAALYLTIKALDRILFLFKLKGAFFEAMIIK